MYTQDSTSNSFSLEEITHFVELLERSPHKSLSSGAISEACPSIYEHMSIAGTVLGFIGFDQTVWWKNSYLIPLALKSVSSIENRGIRTKLNGKILQIHPLTKRTQPSFVCAIHDCFFAPRKPHIASQGWHALDTLIRTVEEHIHPLSAVEEIYRSLSQPKVIMQCTTKQINDLYRVLECLEQQTINGIAFYETPCNETGESGILRMTKHNVRRQILAYTSASLILLDRSTVRNEQNEQAKCIRVEAFKKRFSDHPLFKTLGTLS